MLSYRGASLRSEFNRRMDSNLLLLQISLLALVKIGLLSLLPLFVVNTKTLLPGGTIVVAVHDFRPVCKMFAHRIGVLFAPVSNNLLLVARCDAEVLVMRQRIRAHTKN